MFGLVVSGRRYSGKDNVKAMYSGIRKLFTNKDTKKIISNKKFR